MTSYIICRYEPTATPGKFSKKPADWRTGTAEWRLGDCLSHLGLKAEAEKLLLAGVKKLREDTTAPPGTLTPALETLADHYERSGQSERAQPIRSELKPPVK